MIQAMKNAKMVRELDNLVKAIGECKSKSEEDRIIAHELETLKQRFNDPKIDKSRGREYMVRLIYCEMLGHDASFAYIHALQFASDPNILTKKAAYLTITQLLDYKSELVLLLVNTLLSDLKSDNFIIVCTALGVATKLISPDLINAVYPVVVEKLKHPKEHVRKKALMALHHFHQLDPHHSGPLAGANIDKHFRTLLCDKDPSVMSTSLCGLHDLVKEDPNAYKNLIPSFTSILKQVSEHRLPKSYDYHRFPAPFIQIKLLKLLALLGAGDKTASDNMYAVIHQALKRAHSSHTIGNAIIYECVRTITTIYPNPTLLAAAAESVSSFLRHPSHNLRYIGLDALSGIVTINPQFGQEHQLAVIDCLEDPDDTLKLKTLELLYNMTKANNVEVVVDRMMTYLRTITDDHIRKDIVVKVSELAERYAPDTYWFIGVMSEVFELGGSHVDEQLAHHLMKLIAEQDQELHAAAVNIFLKLLQKPKLPSVLLMTIVWVLGEYGYLATQGPDLLTAQQLIDRLCGVLDLYKPSEAVQGYIITAILKLCSSCGVGLTYEAEELVHKYSRTHSVELQQRAQELTTSLASDRSTLTCILPTNGATVVLDDSEMEECSSLSFLNDYVREAQARGAAPYITREERLGLASNGAPSHAAHALRFSAYEPATIPSQPVASQVASPWSAPAASLPKMTQVADPFAPGPSPAFPVPAPAVTAYGQQPQGPQLMLKASGPRKWGPVQAEPPPAPASTSSFSPGSLLSSPEASSLHAIKTGHLTLPTNTSQTKEQMEKDRLAASLFGTGASTTPSKFGRSPGAKGARGSPLSPASVQPVVDLLGSPTDLGASRSTGTPTSVPAPKSDLDLLMDLADPQPAGTSLPGGVMSPGGSSLGALGGLDILGEPVAAGLPAALPASPKVVNDGDLLDLDGLYSGPTSPSVLPAIPTSSSQGLTPGGPRPQPFPNAPGMGSQPASQAPAPVPGRMPMKSSMAPMRSTNSNRNLDPFSDLLG